MVAVSRKKERMMRQTILLFAAVLSVASAADGSNCSNFKCHHNSRCKSGSADSSPFASFEFAILSETARDGHHCDCHGGYTGLQCDHRYEICDSASNPNFACFHGGTCVKHKNEWTCDCTSAEFMGNKVHAAGNNCEVLATATCDASGDGLEGDEWFCTNGGACRDNQSDIHAKCNCPSGFKGEKCQYKKDSVVKECNLECKHGGQCAYGAKEHGKEHVEEELYFTKDKFVDGMHCVCPEGYAGVRCEVKLEKCSAKFCYHGAKCLKEEDDFGGAFHYCDCSTATDLEASGTLFVGRFCQHKGTDRCEFQDSEKNYVCANGGKCKMNPHEGCDCINGFTGPLCEYKKEEEPKCKLSCKNGGQCRKGISQNTMLQQKFDLALKSESHINFEHCSCPEGFYGIDCSIKVKKCGNDGEHVCANGGECVAMGTNKDGKIKWGCDCLGGTTAGQHCEHEATELCIISGNPDDAGHSFCTNGGTCVEMFKNKNKGHVGCDCPDGYEGKKCQYKAGQEYTKEISTPKHVQSSSSSGSSSPTSSSSPRFEMAAGGKIIVAALVIGVIAVALVIMRRKIVLRKSGKEDFSANMTTEEIASTNDNDASFDDGDEEGMKNVEII